MKQVLLESPNASEAYISVEGRCPMILRTVGKSPKDRPGVVSVSDGQGRILL